MVDLAASFVVVLALDYVKEPSMGHHYKRAEIHWWVVWRVVPVVLVHSGTLTEEIHQTLTGLCLVFDSLPALGLGE